ncbi:MAG: ATP-binding cassette domain-containing protein [Bacilli bacterium]|jgi:putative ABC transport system permease protein|nr:ATP-binding cassette domain-containing protein [Bacilli bacterium]
MLRLNNIDKDYYMGSTTVHALKKVNIEFRKSEFVAILGPSGCGKTTLLNLIGGLDRYTAGDIMINNRSTKEYKDADWDAYRNHSVGFVFQTYNLIPHLKVLGNVELALTLSGVSMEERKKRAIEALNKVGLHDQIYKLPNQLSGGQMQRVAIARALVNDPDILLADEPTGALDSETSLQIMEILKEIAKDRLVIMVTHNPDLANQYATRIIRLLDGVVISDSNPYQSELTKKDQTKGERFKHTSMSFMTALALSFQNLLTKKARTILTAFAGSIGIIGIALVLALSNGFQSYVDKMQADTLSSYPLVISRESVDFASMAELNMDTSIEEYPDVETVYVNKLMGKLDGLIIRNNITDEYIANVIEKIDPSLVNGITYSRGVRLNVFKEKTINNKTYYTQITPQSDMQSVISMGGTDTWQEIIDNPTFINSQYDVIAGRLPQDKDELIIQVDKYNQITDLTLMSLGLYDTFSPVDTFSFEELLNLEYKLILNDDLYDYDEGNNKFDKQAQNDLEISSVVTTADVYQKGLTLKVVGIVRVNDITNTGSITGAIGYTKDLTDYILEEAGKSEIVNWQKENPTKNPLTGQEYLGDQNLKEQQYFDSISKLGGISTPKTINIYPVDFKAKTAIKKHLDNYNQSQENKIYYTDVMDLLVKSINTTINAISYVLIAFTSISLVVSSIMIGIITYISVLERTKEIGILRSIGARKKDISRVFNAETLIIGFVAGIIGISVTLILSILINIIINNLVNISNIATLKTFHGIFLILISMGLTLISGIIPSRIAAKKDPVIALRTE